MSQCGFDPYLPPSIMRQCEHIVSVAAGVIKSGSQTLRVTHVCVTVQFTTREAALQFVFCQ